MDETPALRRAVADDAAAVRVLTREAYAKWVPVIGREPLPMRADYDEAVREHRVDLAFLDGGLAALIQTIDKGDHLVIENVAVAPAFQGHGLGRYLLAHAERLGCGPRRLDPRPACRRGPRHTPHPSPGGC